MIKRCAKKEVLILFKKRKKQEWKRTTFDKYISPCVATINKNKFLTRGKFFNWKWKHNLSFQTFICFVMKKQTKKEYEYKEKKKKHQPGYFQNKCEINHMIAFCPGQCWNLRSQILKHITVIHDNMGEKALEGWIVLDWMFWNDHPTKLKRETSGWKILKVEGFKALGFDPQPPSGGQAKSKPATQRVFWVEIQRGWIVILMCIGYIWDKMS